MASGKPRSGKRNSSSSSSSYLSTITLLVFIALCVLGVWVLTSSSVVPQQSIRTSNSFSSLNTNSHFSAKSSVSHKDPPAFDDTPGDLPDDALKGDADQDTKSDELKQSIERTNEVLTKPLEPKLETEEISNANTNEDEPEKEGSSSSTEENSQNQENESAEEEQKQENQGTNTGDDNSNENQQMEKSNTDTEQETTTQQTKDEESNVNNQELQSHEEQIQQDPEVEKENPNQNQQDPEVESHENPNQTQQDPEIESKENPQQTQSDSGEENTSQKPIMLLAEDNQQHTQQESSNDDTQQQNSQPEIQEVTSEDHHHQQQQQQQQQQEQEQTQQESSNDETQQSQTNEDQQSQQSTEGNTEVENQESQKSTENENNTSNQEETHQEISNSSEEKSSESNSGDSFPAGAHAGIPKESKESNRAWSTQADQSENQKERRKDGSSSDGNKDGTIYGYTWELCNVTSGADYIPCLDNEKAIKLLHYTGHFEHRERHCPEDPPTCLVPLPPGYKKPIEWPKSRDKIWYHNVPHTKLAAVKGHQNWVKVTGEFLTFPGGGTQFIHGALHYIDFIQQSVPNIAWGKRTRVVLDVGCGVASFGGYLFERDVLAMSFAPKDEHEAQVQFALERGIPAISAVMGSQRLPFPSRVFDLVHCARCRVPWHAEGGRLLLELNRVLRPGGYFVWSATPVYQKLPEDVEIWKEMSKLTISMCWELFTIKKDKLNSIGAAVYRKPISNDCYEQRKHNSPPMCKNDDDPNAAWYVPLQACIHRVPTDEVERGAQWPEEWPARVHKPPYWLNSSQKGIYGKPAPEDFASDYEHWKRVVTKSYMTGLGISWSNVRNVMDMRAVYGGFAAALKDIKVWVMNVVNVDSPDTLPIIYERGLFGMYHDWCESFSTYPRTYDLLHADHLFSRLKKRCKLVPVIAEIDRIVRPGGKLIVRDESSVVGEIENMLKSLHWEIHLTFSKDQEGILSAQKSDWRPNSNSASS